jgi:hypothetical protein
MSNKRCLYVSQSRIIHDAAKRLGEIDAYLQQWTTDSWEQWSSWAKWMSWVFPLLRPLIFPIVTLPSKQEGIWSPHSWKKDCHFFTNKSGIVRYGIKKKTKLGGKAQQLTSSQPTNILSPFYPWLILLVVQLILICLIVMFLRCLINILQKFLQEHITAISQSTSGLQFKAIMLL